MPPSFTRTTTAVRPGGAAVAAKPLVAPYLTPAGALFVLCAAVLLCWPMLLTSAPLVFMDTISYYSNGEAIWSRVLKLVGKLIPGAGPDLARQTGLAGADQSDGANVAISLRSLPYSTFFYPFGSTPLGLVLACIAQTAMVLWVFLALVPPLATRAKRAALIGFAALGTLTTLPWFASYAMPDIVGAILPVYFALALSRLDLLRGWQQLALACLATFAILSHYANLPLAAALAVGALAWRAWRHRLSGLAWAACLAPLFAAVGINVATSLYMASLDRPAGPAQVARSGTDAVPTPTPASGSDVGEAATLTPNRVPVVLARSVQDGPARWYLQEECRDKTRYAVCELFDTIPDNVHDFLWVGLGRATDEQMTRIRAQEVDIVVAAARRYPLEQAEALLGNTAKQFVSIGTGDLWLFPPDAGGMVLNDVRPSESSSKGLPVFVLFDWISFLATGLAGALLTWRVVTGRTQNFLTEAAIMIVFALLVNAAICGGLSAPVDRYQSRLAWLIPALLALDLALRPFVWRGRHSAEQAT